MLPSLLAACMFLPHANYTANRIHSCFWQQRGLFSGNRLPVGVRLTCRFYDENTLSVCTTLPLCTCRMVSSCAAESWPTWVRLTSNVKHSRQHCLRVICSGLCVFVEFGEGDNTPVSLTPSVLSVCHRRHCICIRVDGSTSQCKTTPDHTGQYCA